MKEYFEIISRCALFDGIEQVDLEAMIRCLKGRTMNASKGDPVFLEDDPARFVGVVLSGTVHVVR